MIPGADTTLLCPGKLTTSQLSVDQTPDRPDERQRIEELGGVVGMIDMSDSPSVVSIEEASASGEAFGPARVYFPEGSWDPPHGAFLCSSSWALSVLFCSSSCLGS